MEVLEIVSTGPLATVQDLGRPGRMKYGVPPGGALDREALQVANALVGNDLGAPGVEITLGGFSAVALRPVLVAVAGAWAPMDVDGVPAQPYTTVQLEAGQTLNIGHAAWGARVYLAVAGGVAARAVLGSASTFGRGKMGGLDGDGKPLRSGDTITAAGGQAQSPGSMNPSAARDWATAALIRRAAALASAGTAEGAVMLRVVMGPQDHLFTEDGITTFTSSVYVVTPLTDRMGARLAGPTVAHKGGADIVSDGIPAGAIQIPGDGNPIIMLADRQTTGGYTKIACLASADLDIAGQLRPGDHVRFQFVSVEEAHALLEQDRAARTRPSLALSLLGDGLEHVVRVVEIT